MKRATKKDKHPKDKHDKSESKNRFKGSVQAFNISPKGAYEGLLMDSGKQILQFNFPPELGARISSAAPVGSEVEVTGEPHEDERPRRHEVYHLVTLKAPGGDKLDIASAAGPEYVRVKGVVKRLNYAKHGEVNGAVLENGDFVHLRPHGAKAIELAVGQTITAEGETRPTSLPGRVVEAVTVDGLDLEALKKKAPKKHAQKKKAPKKKPAKTKQ